MFAVSHFVRFCLPNDCLAPGIALTPDVGCIGESSGSTGGDQVLSEKMSEAVHDQGNLTLPENVP